MRAMHEALRVANMFVGRVDSSKEWCVGCSAILVCRSCCCCGGQGRVVEWKDWDGVEVVDLQF